MFSSKQNALSASAASIGVTCLCLNGHFISNVPVPQHLQLTIPLTVAPKKTSNLLI